MDTQTAQMILELTLENSKLNKEVNELRDQIALVKPKKAPRPIDPDAPIQERKKKSGLTPEELSVVRKENGLRLAKSNKEKKEHFERLKAKESSASENSASDNE